MMSFELPDGLYPVSDIQDYIKYMKNIKYIKNMNYINTYLHQKY